MRARLPAPGLVLLPALFAALAPPLAARAAAEWQSIGAMGAPAREGAALLFRNDRAVAAVAALSPHVIRVRIAPGRRFGRDHSYAVVFRPPGDPAARITIGRDRSMIATSALRVVIRHSPFRIAIEDAGGASLDEDDPEKGIAFSGATVRVWKRLRDDEQIYGLGEKTGRLNKRGRKLGGYTYAMWNSDTFAYGMDTDPIYASVPFYLVLRQGRAHGIFLDNTFRTSFDIGHTSHGLLSFGADGGELDYYFIDGPAPRDVVARYTELTGRMPLPPLWALGYHQCRYSYFPDSRVRFIAANFRERRIPADVLWLDIHYQDRYRPFTWDRRRFPDPARLAADLRAQGFRLVAIVDPHPAKVPGTEVYDTGLAGGHFVTRPDGSIYEAPVWPSQAEDDPRPSVFPDFSRPATREWWGGLYRSLLDAGIAGIWNDMNEPAVFVDPTGTFPLDVRHDNEGAPTDHREIHNVYGMLMSRATYEGLRRLRPGERPFVLTRASFAGGQRYAALWPGDNVSTWEHLRGSIPMLLNMGLSGLAFVGADIGGFADAPTAELYTRWLQLGVFYPFMRTHTMFGTPDQEPWSYGPRHEAINRRAIELRYELLPYIYNVMREASETGVPAMRPLLVEYPDDPATWELDEQFLFGRDLLVAPVLREGATRLGVYLPRGRWYDFWTGAPYEGGRTHEIPVTLESIPLFVREGAFLFRQPVVQHTGEMRGQPLRVTVYPAAASGTLFYEDDGLSFEYTKGRYLRRRFAQRREGRSVVLTVGAPEGEYRPAPRDLILQVRVDVEPARVLVGGTPLSRDAWRLEQGFVVVSVPDRVEPFEVRVE
ncbi:MAG TPA: glycoside hydrolase family 31 protein [Vicinamibacterales bacterium]|nr:glycoside hydrolase family 31 protein [Vicinamibacterales bacterium]